MHIIEPTLWLTVDEAYSLCLSKGLSRTKKTIRQWCRQNHVECEKRTTSNGEQWMLDRASLEVKIQSELDFLSTRHSEPKRVDRFEPVRATDEPDQTGAHPFEPVRTRANEAEPTQTAEHREELRNLDLQIRTLEIDKGIRDQQIKYLETENGKGRDALNAQSRYIGHLETIAIQSGAEPEAKYLASPLPNNQSGADIPVGEIVEPGRQNLGYNNDNGKARQFG